MWGRGGGGGDGNGKKVGRVERERGGGCSVIREEKTMEKGWGGWRERGGLFSDQREREMKKQ